MVEVVVVVVVACVLFVGIFIYAYTCVMSSSHATRMTAPNQPDSNEAAEVADVQIEER